MTKPNKKAKLAGAPAYPDKTVGSETLTFVRKQADDWSEETRAQLFEQGMQIIYGGTASASAKVRP